MKENWCPEKVEVDKDEEFTKERETLKAQIARLEKEQRETAGRAEKWFELTEQTFKFACGAREAFASGSYETKRSILSALGSNPTLLDGKLRIEPNKWLIPIAERYPALAAEYERVRTADYPDVDTKTAAFAAVYNSWGE